jgi:Tol biopolymer transport system component
MDLWMLPLTAERVPTPILRTRFTESSPRLSPDSRWMAYRSDESGRGEVYVTSFPNPGGKVLISTDGGTAPVWSHDGRELYYRNGDKMMAVPMASGPTLTPGSPRLVFEGHYQISDAGVAGYDVAADGRFLMVEAKSQEQSAARINIVLHWFDELTHSVAR